MTPRGIVQVTEDRNADHPAVRRECLIYTAAATTLKKEAGELTFAAPLTNGSDAENSPENLRQDGIAKRGKQAHATDFRE